MAVATLSDEAQLLVTYVTEKLHSAEDLHKARCERWAKWYRLYRSRQELKRTWAAAAPRDVDTILNDARSMFDEGLFIPYVYSVIETQLPRMLAQNPKMNVTPAPVWQGAVPNADISQLQEHADTLKLAFDRYQTYMRYPITLQSIGKSGLIYGLGVGKLGWKDEKRRSAPKIVRSILPTQGNVWVQGKADKMKYSGPWAEAVDIWDWIADPAGYDMATMDWTIHRTWRNGEYAAKMIESGAWELPKGVTLEDLLSSGSERGRDETWKDRMEAAGVTNPTAGRGGAHMHEVLEFNDGDDVITLWDRQVPVQAGDNPWWHGEQPYGIFRPTIVPHELLGIGEPEAIEDLQFEMNETRSIRLANSKVVVQRPFAYFEGLADPGDFEFGPAAMWPVDGDPSELIHAIPLADLPASAYQEEARLQADIERVSGLNDQEQGGGGGDTTATQAQLVHTAANSRIANKTMLLTGEMITPQAQQMLSLLQQKIRSEVYMAGPPKPGDPPGSVWSYYVLSPDVMDSDWLVEADGGSLAPDNVPQLRDDATRLQNMYAADPMIDPLWLREQVLTKMGVKDARAHLVPPVPQVPAPAIDMALQQLAAEVGQMGIDPAEFMQHAQMLIAAAVQQQQPAGPPGEGGPPAPGGQQAQLPTGEPAPVR